MRAVLSWLALACAAAAYAWAVWGGNPVSFWANSGSATPPHKVFTVEELSRFTGGAPLNLTKIAEVRAAAEDKQAEQAKNEKENCDDRAKVSVPRAAAGQKRKRPQGRRRFTEPGPEPEPERNQHHHCH